MAREKRVLKSRQFQKRPPFMDFLRRFFSNKGALVGTVITLILVCIALLADVIYDFDTDIMGYNIREMLVRPCKAHPFGTDDLGRDLFTRVIYGTKYSMLIAFAATFTSVAIGLPIGAVAAYYGGWVDLLIFRIFDVIGSIPGLLLGIIVVTVFGQNIAVLILAIAIPSIGSQAGNTRLAVMTVRSEEYIESARAIGMRPLQVIFKHVIPNSMNLIVVRLTLAIGNAIISASSLSYLGLGVSAPTPEWGALLSAGRTLIRSHSYLTLFPGLAIMITVMALNLMGDGLRDALDPKLKH